MATKQYAAKVTIGGALQASFKNAFGGASAAVKKLGDEVKALGRQRADIKAFRASTESVRKFEEQLAKAKAKLDAAKAALASASKPTTKLTNDVNRAQREVDGLNSKLGEESSRLANLKAKLDAAKISTTALDKADAKLEARIARLNRTMQRHEAAKDRFGKARSNLGSWTGAAFTAGAAVAAWIPAIKAAASYEQKLFEVKRVGELTTEQTKDLGKFAMFAVDSTNRGPGALVGVMGEMVAMGASVEQAKESIIGIGRASVATGVDMGDLNKALFQAQQQLGIVAKESERAFGIMAVAGKRGNFEIRDMAGHLPTVAAAAGNVGLKGEQGLATLTSALQIARKGAGDSSTAANNLLNLLTKLTAPTTVKKMKDNFGVDWEKELKRAKKKGLDPLLFSLDRIQKLTKGDSFKIGEIFEDMQVKAALIPLLKFRSELDSIRKDSLSRGGSIIGKDFGDSLETWPEIFNSIKASVESLGIAIGDELKPVVAKFALGLKGMLASFRKWKEENPKLFSTIVKVAAGATALAAAIFGIGMAVAGLQFAWSGISVLLSGLGVIGAPAIAAFAGIAAAATSVVVVIRKYWEPISAWFQGVWAGIVEGWNSAGGPALFEEIKGYFKAAVDWVTELIKPVSMTDEEFKKTFDSGKVVGEFIGKTLVGFIRECINAVTDMANSFKQMGSDIAWVFNKIKDAAKPVFDWIGEKIDWLSGKMSFLSDWGFNANGGGLAPPPKIKSSFGTGGAVPGGFMPPTSYQPPAMRGAGGPRAVNINVNAAPGQSEEAVAAAVMRRLRAEQDAANRGALYDEALAA